MSLATLKRRIWLKVLGVAHEPSADQYHSFPESVERIGHSARAARQNGYVDFPQFVHLETLATCNAACEFCPYVKLERKGVRMPDHLIEKVVKELGESPKKLPFLFAPYKVSDPFLEPRLFDIMGLVSERLPLARIALITNGSPLTTRAMERLAEFRNVAYLNVSLNSDNADEYERTMNIPFKRTLKRLDELHQRASGRLFAFPVRLTRVAVDRESDSRFLAFCEQRYPLFKSMIAPRNDWIGEVVTTGSNTRVPDAPCHRWFDLSIVATGEVALCCMDGEARYSKGNVARQHVLEIYNQPHLRRLRETLPSRLAAADPCRRCTYLTG
jgi:hypothetical protein